MDILAAQPGETGYYKLALTLANLVQVRSAPCPGHLPGLSREVAVRTGQPAHADAQRLAALRRLLAGRDRVPVCAGAPLIRIVYTPEYLPAYRLC